MNSTDILKKEKDEIIRIASSNKKDHLQCEWKENADSFYTEFSNADNIAKYKFEDIQEFKETLVRILDIDDDSDEIVNICTASYFKARSMIKPGEYNRQKNSHKEDSEDKLPDFVYVF